MGFAQTIIGGYNQASQYSTQARQALIQGQAAKNAAYAKATASEQATKKQLYQVGENMRRTAANKRRAAGDARAAAAMKGFALEGAASKQEELVNKSYDEAMADMARSGSTGSMNALDEQIALRRGGDAALFNAQTEAMQYNAMAKATRTGAFISALGSAVGAIGGGIGASKAGMTGWKNIAGAALQGANGVSGFTAAFNPFMSQFASDDWDKYMLDMMGIGTTKKAQ